MEAKLFEEDEILVMEFANNLPLGVGVLFKAMNLISVILSLHLDFAFSLILL